MEPQGKQLTAAQLAVTSAALEGDAGSIYHMVLDLLGSGMPFESVLFDLLAPVQAAMGHGWHSGDYLVSEEHAATAAVETVVALLAGSLEQPTDAARVVVAAVEGDTHSLPARLIAAHLLFSGYKTTLLGATMPASDLQEYLAGDVPDVLVLTCAMTMHLPGAARSIAAAHAAGVPVVVGGPAFGPDGVWAQRLGADAWVAETADVAAKLGDWDLKLSTRDHPPPGELETLVESRSLYVTGAGVALSVHGETNGAQYLEELALLFDVLVAATAVDDNAVLIEFAGWLAALLDARGHHGSLAPMMLEALRAVVEPSFPEASARLAAAAAQFDAS